MNYLQYGRKARVLVQDNNQNILDISDLRITFKVETVLNYGQVYTVVNIFNLNAETEKTIIKQYSKVIIEAGYEGSEIYGIIFNGEILQPVRWKEDANTYVLSLICVDGNNYLTLGGLNFSVVKGQTCRDIIGHISKKSNVPAELGSISEGLSSSSLPRGKVFFGKSKDYLRQVAQSNNAAFFMKDGKINIVKLTDQPAGQAIEINANTGMIGMPEQIDGGDGCYVKVKALLNPNLKIGSLIKLNNSDIKELGLQFGQAQWLLDIDGLYLIVKADYIGDTRGQDWYVEMTCANHTGQQPVMLVDPSQGGF